MIISGHGMAQNPFRKKKFIWNGDISAKINGGPERLKEKITLDSTYTLYIRKICGRFASRRSDPVRLWAGRAECDLDTSYNMLTEIQYLYYSAARRQLIFIMFIPNYPFQENRPYRFNRPDVRNTPVVNLWHANCFLFGKLNSTGDQVMFKSWASHNSQPYFITWDLRIAPDESTVEILAVSDLNSKKEFVRREVAGALAVNVRYHRAPSPYPLHLTSIKRSGNSKECNMEQVFYYRNRKDGYSFYIPYTSCTHRDVKPRDALKFKGMKTWGSRLPFDPTPCFDTTP